MNQKIINLFDEYTHAPLTREDFLSRLAKLAGGTAAAMAILPALEGKYAFANKVSEQDEDLKIEDISYPSKNCTMKGYLVMPKNAKGKLGTVLVIHENRGLTPHIKDVTRRIAKAGYIALGIDALSPFGGTPANEDEGRALFPKLDAKQNVENLISGFGYLNELKNSNKKTACVGFCWGGGMVNDIAVNYPELDGGVAYYGRQAAAADVPKIKAKLLLQYGGLDERVNGTRLIQLERWKRIRALLDSDFHRGVCRDGIAVIQLIRAVGIHVGFFLGPPGDRDFVLPGRGTIILRIRREVKRPVLADVPHRPKCFRGVVSHGMEHDDGAIGGFAFDENLARDRVDRWFAVPTATE